MYKCNNYYETEVVVDKSLFFYLLMKDYKKKQKDQSINCQMGSLKYILEN